MILIIAANAVRELVRSKLLYNLLIFAALLIAGSLFVAQLAVADFDRMVDIGLAAVEIVGAIMAVLIGVSIIAGEVERKTILPTLAKPISRTQFLLGRYLGLLVILAINEAVMSGLLALVVKSSGYDLAPAVPTAAVLVFIELALVAALAVVFSAFSTPALATAFSFAFFLIGHLLADVRAYGGRSKSSVAKALTAAAYRALPDLELFNLKSEAANRLPVPPCAVCHAALYGVCYAALLLALAVFIFRRRDLK